MSYELSESAYRDLYEKWAYNSSPFIRRYPAAIGYLKECLSSKYSDCDSMIEEIITREAKKQKFKKYCVGFESSGILKFQLLRFLLTHLEIDRNCLMRLIEKDLEFYRIWGKEHSHLLNSSMGGLGIGWGFNLPKTVDTFEKAMEFAKSFYKKHSPRSSLSFHGLRIHFEEGGRLEKITDRFDNTAKLNEFRKALGMELLQEAKPLNLSDFGIEDDD